MQFSTCIAQFEFICYKFTTRGLSGVGATGVIAPVDFQKMEILKIGQSLIGLRGQSLGTSTY